MAVRYGGLVHQSVERRFEAVDAIIGEGAPAGSGG